MKLRSVFGAREAAGNEKLTCCTWQSCMLNFCKSSIILALVFFSTPHVLVSCNMAGLMNSALCPKLGLEHCAFRLLAFTVQSHQSADLKPG
jgi:hypothetical protein